MRIGPVASLTILWAVLSTGCAALPDVSPFATSTSELAAAVKASEAAVEGEIRRMPNGAVAADALHDAWQARTTLMAAMVRYADSLSAIVQSTRDSRASAKALADQVGALAGAAGLPAAGAAPVVADAAAFVWSQIALARGAQSLREALETVQPAVERIAAKIGADLSDLDIAIQGAVRGVEATIKRDHPEFQTARDTIASTVAAQTTVRARIARATDAAAIVAMKSELEQIQTLDAILASARAAAEPWQRQIDAAEERQRIARELIRSTAGALESWAIAHKDLVEATRNSRPVNVGSLTAAVLEIRGLIKRAKDL